MKSDLHNSITVLQYPVYVYLTLAVSFILLYAFVFLFNVLSFHLEELPLAFLVWQV